MIYQLTEQQMQAVKHYLQHGNKIAAYKSAYAHGPNNRVTAAAAIRLFKKENVKLAVEQLSGRLDEKIVEYEEKELELLMSDLLSTTAAQTARERIREVDQLLNRARVMLYANRTA